MVTDPKKATVLPGPASADQAGYEGYAVTLATSTGYVTKTETATDEAVGILCEEGSGAGASCSYAIAGEAYGHAGGNITSGDLVTAGSGGLITTTSKDNRAIGHALEDAVSGDLFRVQVAPQRLWA